MVCQNALRRAVNELKLVRPAAILDRSVEFVLANFAKSENNLSNFRKEFDHIDDVCVIGVKM